GLAAEVGGEIAPGELHGWRPEGLCGNDRLVAGGAADVGAQIARARAGEKHSAEDRAERTRLDVGAQGRRYRLGDHVGLLRREAALLHGEARRVTGGED